MRFKFIAALTCAALLSFGSTGCTSFNKAVGPGPGSVEDTPQTPAEQANQGIAVALELVASTNDTLATLVIVDLISPNAAESLVNSLAQANEKLRVARLAVSHGDLTTWQGTVRVATGLANDVLLEIRTQKARAAAEKAARKGQVR